MSYRIGDLHYVSEWISPTTYVNWHIRPQAYSQVFLVNLLAAEEYAIMGEWSRAYWSCEVVSILAHRLGHE